MSEPLPIVYIDPPSHHYYEDRLFDHSDPILNRDNTLAPVIRLRETLAQQGIELHTADRLFQSSRTETPSDYYSFGILENYERLKSRDDVNLRAFLIFEPPVVAPKLYKELPRLTKSFDRVYLHNTEGDGYSLNGVNQSRLHKFYWPQPHKDVLSKFWDREKREKRIVMINGNHKPKSFNSELYSRRIDALIALSKFGTVDLYGRGWTTWWSRGSLWFSYLRHRRTVLSIYKGACHSKYEVLSQYSFSLCFENMSMKGYLTEKLFDCLYAGTIPLYLGAKDINDLIPEKAYIDCRRFSSWEDLHDKVMSMSDPEIRTMRDAGRAFIQSKQGLEYYDSLIRVFGE